jgi:hypothetical protein
MAQQILSDAALPRLCMPVCMKSEVGKKDSNVPIVSEPDG